MKLFYIQIIIFFFLFACTHLEKETKNNAQKGLFVIDVEAIFDKKQEIQLSEVAEDITYFPLETRPDNLLDNISQVELTESFIFISDRDKLLQFSRNGKYIQQIGKKGRGPGEYASIMHFAVNEIADNILVLGEYGCYKYDLKGNFIRKVKPHSIWFTFINPNRIAFYRTNHIEQPINIIVSDTELNPLFSFENPNPRAKVNPGFSEAPLYVFENKLFFKENFNDTLFCVEDSILIPHIIYNEKNLLLDKNYSLQSTGSVSDLKNELNKVQDKLLTKRIFESKKFVFTSYLSGLGPMAKDNIRVLFDKQNRNTFITNETGFKNDLDGGINLWPMGISIDSIMFKCQMAFELKTYVASDEFKNSTPKFPEKKKQLEKLANGLSENDNPVLMMVKLKD